MRLSQSIDLLMCCLGNFNAHCKDWQTCSGGTDRPGERGYNFPISNDVTQIVNFATRIPDYDSHTPALLGLFLLTLVFVLQWLSLHWERLIMLLSQFPLTFQWTENRMPCFITWLLTILLLIGMVFMIILKMFHGRISLDSVLVNFVSGFRLRSMDIFIIESIRSNLTYLHGFQQLVLLPYFIEISFFICTNRINLLTLK